MRSTLVLAAPWWTVTELLAAVGILVGVVFGSLAWVVVLRNRVRKQTEKLRDQEVPEMKLASGIRQIRAGLMAAMHDLAEHDTQAADIKMEIDEICTELVRLREKYGPGII